MSLLKRFFYRRNEELIVEKIEKDYIYSPIEGEIIPLKEINDGVFSQEMMGKGCGIKPSNGDLCAPFDGEIILIANTKHAVALKSNDGIEVLIHIGVDTVKMNGKGFSPLVKIGDKVKCGQSIMKFSLSDIESAGYATTTAIIITNSQEYNSVDVLVTGFTKKLDEIIKVS